MKGYDFSLEELYAGAILRREEFLRDLERLTNIDSGTGNAAGLRDLHELVAERLQWLGAAVTREEVLEPQQGFNLKAEWRGEGQGTILLLAHADTVWPPGTAQERPFRRDETRAYGPGVSDDKAGIVIILHAMALLREFGFRQYKKITFLLNGDEEKSSLASRARIMEEAKRHAYALCCEAGKPGDGITVWRKGSGRLTVEVFGRAAHAGSAPEEGRNAVMELAHQILRLGRLGNPDKESTIHFTRIERSANAHNVIPDYAWAQASVRVREPEEFDRIEREARALATQNLIPGALVKVELFRGRPPLPFNEATKDLAEEMAEIYREELGKTLNFVGSGGASDANLAAAHCVVVDSVGVVGGKGHTAEEYLELDSIAPRLYLLARTLMELGRGVKRKKA